MTCGPCPTQRMQQVNHTRIPLIIDADTANEIDDLFAIARALRAAEFDILGLSAAQWSAHEAAPENSVAESLRLNEELLARAGRMDIPHPSGADIPMGHAWGGCDPRPSDAVDHLIATARRFSSDKPLTVVSQGAMTNVASALALAPDIVPRIRAYVLGFFYDAENGVWNKSEFNIRNYLNAADYLLNCDGLDLRVMTATASRSLVFGRDETVKALREGTAMDHMLAERWESFAPEAERWIMWDLALIEALIDPACATAAAVPPPPENTRETVTVYTEIDAERMRGDFFSTVGARREGAGSAGEEGQGHAADYFLR